MVGVATAAVAARAPPSIAGGPSNPPLPPPGTMNDRTACEHDYRGGWGAHIVYSQIIFTTGV